ncbi:hypothetical protein ACIBM1_06515 [Streptomyces sp. NPDC050481]|uniref:hypothetical protein n=1 Tax=Streptomyces sp. NPDC050481 TaxID=3365616 RepID=UPI003791B358
MDSAVTVLGGSGSSSVEAPAMVKVNGMNYVFGSHLTGWSLNDNIYATATSLGGPWSPLRNFAAPGTHTYGGQTANVITVQGSSGTSYVYAGDRWNTADLGSSKLIWLPMTIKGTTVNVGQYPAWSLDAAAGTWTAGSGLPTAGIHTLTNPNSSHPLQRHPRPARVPPRARGAGRSPTTSPGEPPGAPAGRADGNKSANDLGW